MPEEKVAVVIPTHNRKNALIKCVNSVLRQEYGNFEVVVVDDNSEVKVSRDWFAKGPVGIISNRTNIGPAAARNQAISNSDAQIIILLDDDCWVEDVQWISRHVNMQRNSARSLIGGRIANVSQGLFGKIRAMMGDNCMQFRFLQTMNLSFKKSVFEEIGGFNEKFLELEDLDFSQRALRKGISLIYEDDITCYHQGVEGLANILKKQYQYGLWAIPVRKLQRYDGHRILPSGVFSSILLSIPLSAGITFWQILNNITRHPAIFIYTPFIWIYNFSYVTGIVVYYWQNRIFKG